MKKNKLKLGDDQKGFTLIEVLVYGVVFSLFLFLVVQVFVTVTLTSANSLAMINLQQNYSRIFSDLNQTIRNVDEVDFPLAGGSGNTLSLNSGEVIYQLSDGAIQKVVSGSALSLNDEGVSITAIGFENVSEATMASTIKVQMTIQSNYLLENGRQISEDLQTTISLR